MSIYELDGVAPQLPADGQYFIADSAQVIGKVRLGINASVWFGSVVRGDNEPIEIGEGSNVQDNCTLHTDPGFPLIVGANCLVGHNTILHGCTIGDRSLIGMGAIVMNGAKLGNCCVVGAGSLISEGKEFPDRSLIVGAPGRVIRTLTEEQIEALTGGAARYVKNSQRFKAGLKKIG
jgi:carbonic anhydrase/acetyltransferase-like protein (isoleucine patch superfamily)